MHAMIRAFLLSAWASCALVAARDARASDNFNFVIGTQAIYGPDWTGYNFTKADALNENLNEIVELDSNQLKLRMAHDSCAGYRMTGCADVTSLKEQAQVPGFHSAFAKPSIKWYQIWMYTFATAHSALGKWTAEDSAREYAELKEWAVHMLETYSGTGKVFMAGNWEGDWMLMYASGNCRTPENKWNMSCELRQEAVDNMVEWGRTRQRAIDDARREAKASDVSIFYYIEFNHGPFALEGRPGVTNSVIPQVNPDLVSYSSYTATNAFNTDPAKIPAVDANFDAIMDHAQSKVSPKDVPSLEALGFQRRVFIGEYGAGARLDYPTATRFTARVCHAAMKWGVPFALYWEWYYNGGAAPTVAIIPASGEKTPLWHLFDNFFSKARTYVDTYAKLHKGSTPSALQFSKWGAAFFAPAEKGSCQIRHNLTFAGEGYEAPASTAEECWEHCDENPVCAAGVFDSSSVCYVKYSVDQEVAAGSGVACVKAAPAEDAVEEEAMESILV